MARIGGDIGRSGKGKSLEARAKQLRKALGLPEKRQSTRPVMPRGREPGADRWTRLQASSVRGEPAYKPGLGAEALEALARRREERAKGRDARRAAKAAARQGAQPAESALPDAPEGRNPSRFPEIAPERPGRVEPEVHFATDEDTPEPEAQKPRRRGWFFRRRKDR